MWRSALTMLRDPFSTNIALGQSIVSILIPRKKVDLYLNGIYEISLDNINFKLYWQVKRHLKNIRLN